MVVVVVVVVVVCIWMNVRFYWIVFLWNKLKRVCKEHQKVKCSWDFLSGLCFNHLIKASFVGLYLCWRCFRKPDPIHTVKLGCDGADYTEAQILWRKVNWNVWPEADWTVLCFRRCAHGRLWNGQPRFFWCCQTRHASPDPGWQQRHPCVQPGWGGLCCHPPTPWPHPSL